MVTYTALFQFVTMLCAVAGVIIKLSKKEK